MSFSSFHLGAYADYKRTSDYDRNKFVNLTSVGVGYHIFKYPDISVDIIFEGWSTRSCILGGGSFP